MNDSMHPLDPTLKPVFSKEAYRTARRLPQDGRSLFNLLLQNREQCAVYPLAYHLIQRHLSAAVPSEKSNGSGEWLESLPVEPVPVPAVSFTADLLKTCVTHALPVILNEPCWLHESLPTAANQSPLALGLSAVCKTLTKDDMLTKRFQALVLHAGLDIPVLVSTSFAEWTTIDEIFFEFAAVQVALARFPRVFFPEILGFTLAYCQSPCLFEQVTECRQDSQLSDYLKFRQSHLSSVKPALVKLIHATLAEFATQEPVLRLRIESGYLLYCRLNGHCRHRLREILEHPVSACRALAKLMTEKASAASGHHRNIMLEGRSLDDWFNERPFDTENFLAALSASPYVDRENPAASSLLKLFEFDGPMFGVLSETEYGILKNGLMNSQDLPSITPVPSVPPIAGSYLPEENGGEMILYGRLSKRELYYYLVNADLFPDVLPAARKIVERVLRSSRWFSRLPFGNYSHAAYSAYIDSLYQREMKAFEPLNGQPKLSRLAYVWGVEQFAPTILTDGCWLQHANRLRYTSHQAIGRLLCKIFDDENGNGVLEQNHPHIYHQLLRGLEINLPPIYTQSFCRHAGFIDNAFDIPVFLLSIAQFPQEFLPELLGLNLAIELSGLGKMYMRLAQELKFWGIDPKIVNVHITIDNVASGHAALAKNAIQLYLDQISAAQGDAAMQKHWRRTHTGYCSLAAVSRSFAFALIVHYLYRRIKGRYTKPHPSTRRSDQNV